MFAAAIVPSRLRRHIRRCRAVSELTTRSEVTTRCTTVYGKRSQQGARPRCTDTECRACQEEAAPCQSRRPRPRPRRRRVEIPDPEESRNAPPPLCVALLFRRHLPTAVLTANTPSTPQRTSTARMVTTQTATDTHGNGAHRHITHVHDMHIHNAHVRGMHGNDTHNNEAHGCDTHIPQLQETGLTQHESHGQDVYGHDDHQNARGKERNERHARLRSGLVWRQSVTVLLANRGVAAAIVPVPDDRAGVVNVPSTEGAGLHGSPSRPSAPRPTK